MRILVLLPVSGPDAPLQRLAERSLLVERARGHAIHTRVLDGKASHGTKLDFGKTLAPDYDLVVTMDSDCVVFPGWAEWITRTLADPLIGACGAAAIDKQGLHPSMFAMRSTRYVATPSFAATEKKDTGLEVSEWIEAQGLYLQAASVWRGDWWEYFDPDGQAALWWHLGSGTASAWPGWLRQTYRTWKGWTGSRLHKKAAELVWRRRRFIRAATQRLRDAADRARLPVLEEPAE